MDSSAVIAKHFERLKKLLELEEAEEFEQFRQSFLQKTPEERQLAGKALLRLKITEFHFSPAGHRLVSFAYADGKPLPLYSPDPGDMVDLSPHLFPSPVTRGEDRRGDEDLPLGTVYEKEKDVITVAFRRELPVWAHEKGLYHLNIAGSRASSKKMEEALRKTSQAEHNRLAYLRDLSLGIRQPESFDPVDEKQILFFNARLNPWQRKAVLMGLGVRDIGLVHGPPGTGKTTVLVEIIRQTIVQGKTVFATAPSNTACDHFLECLIGCGVPAIRMGHPARIMHHLRAHTLDFKLAHHPDAKTVEEWEFELERLLTQKDRKRDRGSGLSREQYLNIQDEIKALKENIRDLDHHIFKQVMQSTLVFVGTHTSAADPLFKGREFDLVVMDEASQATEPSAWIPISRAHKIILAGDHFQLPPTVISKKAEEGGLGKTLFERFHNKLSEEYRTLLRVQYRMNEKIMEFSSREFYNGKLIADESVKNHCLADLPEVKRKKETEETFLFLDTAGQGFEEKLEPGSESRYNAEEAGLVLRHLKKLLEDGVLASQIAIISPYSAQVRLLASQIPLPEIEVDSVDGFQGREKEAVILSLVRSNVEGEMGFLADTRRMNVAMTRARRQLIVIGDSATLGSMAFYKDFIQYAESIGAYRSSWE